ncbi:hypothetical protein [Natrinema sp. DC36]|uniref:hypothetical protein n=1 Tax=Natrinema sp. DC36 TaxID=2878680 RepID=UPI001CEFD7B0|nr:hypothetical protein [Natrinema sp. DC36]
MRDRRRPGPVTSPRDLEALAAHVALEVDGIGHWTGLLALDTSAVLAGLVSYVGLGEYDGVRMRRTFRDRIGTHLS